MSKSKPILCGECKVEVKGLINDETGSKTVTCPVCGRTDSFDDAAGVTGTGYAIPYRNGRSSWALSP